jgi:hypothetical protein
MKKFLLAIVPLCLTVVSLQAKEYKVAVTPSNAKIYVDGNYYADGVATINLKSKTGFVVVKMECPGYITTEAKIYAGDKRNAISYTLRRDGFFDVSVASGLVNKYFNVKVSKDLYKIGEDGKIDVSLAWKMIHKVILNYFDEIQTTDIASGFVQTPWKYTTFPDAEKQVRTRVSVKQNSFGDELSFQIKVSSEAGSVYASRRDESFQEIDRILKELEPIISEFQTRLGDK